MTVRALRGATQLDTDDAEHLLERTAELMTTVLDRNELTPDDVISIFLTATPDLRSAFPAVAVRRLGITDVPMMCAQEIAVSGALPRVVRLMAHVETTKPRSAMRHVYLHGTTVLRDDLADR
ncbi:chorismate mutase [Jiangella alkaliphila]|uniref:chorismate mutase n=1 Tax=Jiangella alkaliphila TaxID=419479 RepID=A0A1H2KPZ0_9ACTN|nr:chorismate mutase [Jiangella alkaliphila]SDU70747.1 chorismate mutase [Jiangella alkaliphila]